MAQNILLEKLRKIRDARKFPVLIIGVPILDIIEVV